MVAAGLAGPFRCVAPDLRGHGDSPATPAQVSDWHRFGSDVLAIVDQLDLAAGGSPPVGFGHSMGGAALVLAELARPGTFAGLWLFEPILPPLHTINFEGPNPMADAAERRREVFESYGAAIENYSSKPPLDVFTRPAMEAYVMYGFAPLRDGTVRLKCRGAVEAATFRGAGAHHAFSRLGEVTCPVVIGVGRVEELGPASFADAAVAALPSGRAEHFDHLGHFAPQEAPAEVAAAVLHAFPRQ